MAPKYIVMANTTPIHVIVEAYKVRMIDCIFVTKYNRGANIMGLIPRGMKILRFKHNGRYDIDRLQPIPDDWGTARDIRNALIAEARNW